MDFNELKSRIESLLEEYESKNNNCVLGCYLISNYEINQTLYEWDGAHLTQNDALYKTWYKGE